MDVLERKYRFSEIMSAVSLLPEISMQDELSDEEAEVAKEWLLPNSTSGFEDMKVRNAVICQAMREDTEFKFKLVALLSNTALQSIAEARDKDTKPSDADLQALAVSANILWAGGEARGLFQLLGLLGSVCGTFDMELPSLATTFLRSNSSVERYGKLDPFDILEEKITREDIEKAVKEE